MSTERERAPGDDSSFWSRLLSVRREERTTVVLAVLAFFCLLFAIFLLRPLRDEMGLRGGARKLKYLWTFTLLGTIVASTAFAACASRFPRRTFMAWTYRAVALVWLAFLALVPVFDATSASGIFVARAFYVVHAVSNVFIVSIFWALAADLLEASQARRLFGLIAVGGTLGAMAGTAVTGAVAKSGWALWTIFPAVVLIEIGVQIASRLSRQVERTRTDAASSAHQPLGGHALEGMALVARSPYLQGIAAFTFLFGVVQTFLTLQQQHVVEGAIADLDERTAYFAWTENAAQTLTLLVQLFVTGQLMKRIGIGGALLVLPLVGVLGFGVLSLSYAVQAGALVAVTVCLVAWRGLSHSTMRPAREALYVSTARAEKFKAKSFTDTFAFRGGDLASAWSFDAFSLAAAAMAGIPLAAAWGALGVWLGRKQRALARELPADQGATEIARSPAQ